MLGSTNGRNPLSLILVSVYTAFLGTVPGWAGGSPENMLLILDPANPQSQYIGNYYRNVRNVPASNILYLSPDAASYQAFVAYNQVALLGTLVQNHIDDHIDYVVIMPGANFFVNAPSLISDGCSPVARFSISACYTMPYISSAILAGGMNSQETNRYYGTGSVQPFDSNTLYFNGAPNTSTSARRYFIGCMLGYTGDMGNDLPTLISMIDRDVAVDGTHPVGTFYFMNNTADPARNVRQPEYAAAISAIQTAGGAAVQINDVLPNNAQDCAGVMTGNAIIPLSLANMTIEPGAYCDHLTSWGATFDNPNQSKISDWIAFGAGGSYGTVEEPCNYTQKFPNAKVHWFYYKGLSLGESCFRSLAAVPFQGLMYGDPMTRPYAWLPTINVSGLPGGSASGTVILTPSANHPNPDPNAVINTFDLLVDGRRLGGAPAGGSFMFNTNYVSDGWHDLRVLGYENTTVKTVGRFVGAITVNNHGRTTTMTIPTTSGNWTTPFTFNCSAVGGASEIRLIQNGRVVAAAAGGAAIFTVYGATLGAGPVTVQAEGYYADGNTVRSAPQTLQVSYSGGTPAAPPVAYSYTKPIRYRGTAMVELPAGYDNAQTPLTFSTLSSPTKVTTPGGQAGAYRLVTTIGSGVGTDIFTYQANSPQGNSNVATVTLMFDDCADITGDRVVDLSDVALLLSMYGTCITNSNFNPNYDLDGNNCIDLGDLAQVLAQFGRVCAWY